MLPFLKPKKMAASIMMTHKKDGEVESHEEGEEVGGLMVAAEDLISAIHAKDAQAVCVALKAAFEIMEEEPHVEGEHIQE